MNYKSTLVMVLLSTFPCFAKVALNPEQVLEFKVAQSGMTRISMDNDSIEDVYAYPAEPDLITHHKSGHVFITPDGLDGPIYVTVITRKGTAQDLKLMPIAKKASPILLHAQEKALPVSPQDTYAHLLGQFIQGKVPPDFYVCPLKEVSRGKGSIEAILDKAYQNPDLRVLVFTIKNTDSERRGLDHQEFWGKGDLASSFDRSALNPQETARFIVIQQR